MNKGAAILILSWAAGGCVMPGGGAVGGVAPNVKETQADEAPVPLVLVNQVGYLPDRPKLGVVQTTVPTPLAYTVRDSAEQVVFQGQTKPFGKDAASGLTVHRIDFSACQAEGSGFTLQVETTPPTRSHSFDLKKDLYARLKYDALAFFYHQRSGVPIELPYAEQAQWARPAGHLTDEAVPCLPGSGCDYELNVKGGWYDAGDHGKYVVNGGVSVWLLQALWERSTIVGAAAAAAFADGAVNIPERTNGFPDLLDEARFELEFMLRMQVPKSEPLAGMVHHKMHDRAWTPLGLPPHLDKQPRFLHKPTTAATLNLAAVAAQASRLWKTLDPKFSARCLRAAKRAYAAAEAHPEMFAAKQGQGGGPYDDDDISDERYWAAAELFITTGQDAYLEVVRQRPARSTLFGEAQPAASGACFSWQSTATLGALSLAMAPSKLPESEREALRMLVQKTADEVVHITDEQAFASSLRPFAKGYVWGSNGDALGNLVVVALAYDFTKGDHYADAVSTAMSYLLGRNPLDKSYIAGYGERPLRNPHHRFWAQQLSSRYPPPPPGAVSGGPNSELQDPVARHAGLRGCAPQACYVDHSGAYSVNEVAINWNAPLVWVAAFLDELR